MNDTAPSPNVRILIVDHQTLFREGVAGILDAEPDFEVVAHCASAQEALNIMSQAKVDMVLLEFIPGQKQQFDFFEQAMHAGFNGKVLTVTAGLSEIESAELIRLGVSGIFMKHHSAVALSDGIRQVMGGQTWFEHKYLTALLKAPGSRNLSSQQSRSKFSRREREVLALILDGCTNKQIAVRLQTSEGAIKATVNQLLLKAGVRTRSQLVRVAFERRRIPPE